MIRQLKYFPLLLSSFLVCCASADVLVIGSDGVTPGVNSPDVEVGSYIRADQPGTSLSDNYLLVGELNGNRGSLRGLLSFDLSLIPDGATITSATVSLFQDKTMAGRGAFRPVNLQLFSMTGALSSGSTWNSASGQFDALLDAIPGNTRTVFLNQEFAFSSASLSQYLQNSLSGGALHLGVMVPQANAAEALALLIQLKNL